MRRRFVVASLVVVLAVLGHLAQVTVARGQPPRKAQPAEVLKRLQGVKIISIQDLDKINAIDQEGMPGVWGKSPVNDYDRGYPRRLKEIFGLELIVLRSGELLEEMAKVEEADCEKLAAVWIREATEMRKVKRIDVVRSARLYWAFKALLKKYSAAAITYECATITLSEKKVKAWPPLAILELGKEYIPSVGQSHVDCLVTQLIGCYLTGGYMGFAGDVLNDWSFKPVAQRPANAIIVGHCSAPINPHGTDRIPYVIREHIHAERWGGPNDVAEATTVTWPPDEPATIVKFDVFRKKVSIYTGKVLDGNKLFVDFPNCICRNKILVQIDNPDQCYLLPSSPKEGAFRSWFGSWGCHQVVFYGNLRELFKETAVRAGFQVVEGKK
jgi:hypothetical protein